MRQVGKGAHQTPGKISVVGGVRPFRLVGRRGRGGERWREAIRKPSQLGRGGKLVLSQFGAASISVRPPGSEMTGGWHAATALLAGKF